MSNKKERPSQTLGAISPSAELRKATDELELCSKTFEELGFMDYLNAVNEHYLNNQGLIEGPEKSIKADSGPEAELIDQDRLNLSQASSSISTEITWNAEGEKKLQKRINIRLDYLRDDMAYRLALYAQSTEAEAIDEDIQVGASIQRDFWLIRSISPEISEAVDDALLIFTNELLDSGIISN